MKIHTHHGDYDIRLVFKRYAQNGNLCIGLVMTDTGEPFSTITVNIEKLPEGYFCVDTNNGPHYEAFLIENNIGTPVGTSLASGYCTYPIYELNTSKESTPKEPCLSNTFEPTEEEKAFFDKF